MATSVVEVRVFRLLYDEATKTPVVLLKEVKGNRILPILIGHPEAQAIAIALQGVQVERPLTHDLLKNMIQGFGGQVEKVVINALKKNTFYARIIVKIDHTLYTVDARPSDSIALALRTKCPIYVSELVMQESSATETIEGL